MDDEQEQGNRLVRGVRRVVDGTQGRLAKLRRPVAWARQAGAQLVVPRIQQQIERLLIALAEPENARRLQEGLAWITQKGMESGFRTDPDAERLYEFVTWLEQRHGRAAVLSTVVEHAASVEVYFAQTLQMILGGYGEPTTSVAHVEAAQQMHELRDVVASDLLDLLCALVALELDETPAHETTEERVAFFERADLPTEYESLGAMAAGIPGAFDLAGASPTEVASTEVGLARFVPSFDDPHLRFLTLSQLFFLHSYLARNLVELLPDLLASASTHPQ